MVPKPGEKYLLASSEGDGFVAPAEELIAQTRAGKQVLNMREGIRTVVFRPWSRAIWSPVSARIARCWSSPRRAAGDGGKGVRLQKFKDGGLADAVTFTRAEGLS